MSNQCLPSIQACALRVARLEANGVPDPGANNLYVSNQLVSITPTPNYREGQEFNMVSGCGDVILDYMDDPRLRWWDVELALATPDPQLTELLAGGDVVTDGDAVGWASPALLQRTNPYGVSIEFWTKQVDENGDLDPDYPYLWWAMPKVKSLRAGAKNAENAAMNNPFVGGRAVQNENWYDGPLNDWPVRSDRPLIYIPTTHLPETMCGYQSIPVS
jgi:hypothetical protein